MKNRKKERRMTVDEVLWSVAEVMDKVGIEESLIYAFVKSGILLKEGDEGLYAPKDVRAWYDSVDEYRAYEESLK